MMKEMQCLDNILHKQEHQTMYVRPDLPVCSTIEGELQCMKIGASSFCGNGR